MNRKLLKEILAAHADQLATGEANNQEYSEHFHHPEEELAPLLDVAERVKVTLQPVRPTHDFESELKRELLTTAHLRRIEGYSPPDPSRDLLILAAMLGFVVSLVAVLLALRLHNQAA
jgi:hypothetical protein